LLKLQHRLEKISQLIHSFENLRRFKHQELRIFFLK
jgi:hypothetical protein